jgi:hypothetical protein
MVGVGMGFGFVAWLPLFDAHPARLAIVTQPAAKNVRLERVA